MASSAVFGKCVLGSMEMRIPSFVAGAPEMVSPRRNFTFGDTVIVDESTLRNVWPIGRITEVFTDKDERESKPRPLLWSDPLRSDVCWNQLNIESV